MKECNTEEYSNYFYNMCENMLSNFKCVGEWSWGNPGGLIKSQSTYEIASRNGIVWCTLIKWSNASGTEINRGGILTTIPSQEKKSLGQITETTIPYYFSHLFNTRAYKDKNHIEIRNYGKFTVGRAGLKKKDFFDYVNDIDSNLIRVDEEENKYITVLDISNNMTKDEFADQIVRFTILIKNFKSKYRV